MHNQHRSPDPTKIERATATSTVALFFFFVHSTEQNQLAIKHLQDQPTAINEEGESSVNFGHMKKT
jgi:hypothetical protein